MKQLISHCGLKVFSGLHLGDFPSVVTASPVLVKLINPYLCAVLIVYLSEVSRKRTFFLLATVCVPLIWFAVPLWSFLCTAGHKDISVITQYSERNRFKLNCKSYTYILYFQIWKNKFWIYLSPSLYTSHTFYRGKKHPNILLSLAALPSQGPIYLLMSRLS